MILDLRQNGQLPIELAQAITTLEPDVRAAYNQYVGELAACNNVAGVDWLAQVTCRNTFISLLHDRFCRLQLLEEVVQKNVQIERILVDSPCFARVVERMCTKLKLSVPVEVRGKNRAGRFAVFPNLLKSIYLSISSWIWPKVVGLNAQIPEQEIVLLDTFILSDSFDEQGTFKDRNYPGLQKVLEQENCADKFWYLPTLIHVKTPKQFMRVFKSVKDSRQNFLLRERFLTVTDYLWALAQSVLIPMRLRSIPDWHGTDIKEIVLEELWLDQGSTALTGSLLTYRFIRRLAKLGVQTKLIVDWHENQTIDRALNLSAKKYFPDAYVIGYQGYVVPDYYACKDPIEAECAGGTVPDEIAVVGDASVPAKSSACPDVSVTVAPAFRFLHLVNTQQSMQENANEILVALPIMIDSCETIVQLCSQAAELRPGLVFVLKIHPAYRTEDFLRKVPEANAACFNVSEESIEHHLPRARLLISAASSVCFEAALMQIPVAIVGNRSGPAMNPLAGIFDSRYWEVVYDGANILAMLDRQRPPQLDLNQYLYSDVRTWLRHILNRHTTLVPPASY